MQIVMVSCEKYADAWTPFMKLLDMFWPRRNRPPVVLISDTMVSEMSFQDLGIDEAYWQNKDFGWCQNLIAGLHYCDELVLLLQEDFFITEPVNIAFIQMCEELMREKPSVAALRLYPCPGPTGPAIDDLGGRIGVFMEDAEYLVSCQATLWRRDVLIDVLKNSGTTAADFEINGTKYARTLKKCWLGFRREEKIWPLQYICTAIVRGKWLPDAVKLCEKYGIPLDTSKRPINPSNQVLDATGKTLT